MVTSPASATTDQQTPTPARTEAAIGTVTLVTGDTVRFQRVGGGIQVVGTTPRTQRGSTTFARLTEHGDQYVIPSDAWHAYADGQLDKGLFDITALVEQGLDDQHTDHVNVIVSGPRGFAPRVSVPATAKVTRSITDLGIRALSTPKSAATALWTSLTGEGARGAEQAKVAAGTKIWLDGVVHATLDQSVPLIGAPTAWQHGYTGQGVKVAVLDTGIDAAHPDLAGKVAVSQNFSDSPDADDHFGHGTHVASIITGSGAASGGRYKGVAPGVSLLSGKVLDDQGGGDDSGILAGMDWAVQQGAKVINMSLGGGASDGTDVLSEEVNTLSASSGALFVIAAGNDGGPSSVESPGAADAALTVASTTKQDTLSTFSSQGPRTGNFGLKPEIAAPGQDIVAARAPGVFPEDAVDANYVKLSGTSMATPHVAGSAAIVASEHPDWTGQQIKSALMDSATVLPGIDVFSDGAGRVDVARATIQTVHTLTPDVSLGDLAWPQDPGTPTTREVTYANDGSAPVTLALALSVTTQGGAAVPSGLFGLTATSLTVPAHGTASATVRVAAGTTSVGSYEGRLVATAAGLQLVTPVAARVDGPTHTLTLHVLDRTGQPASADFLLAVAQNTATGDLYVADPTEDGVAAATVPDGTYRVLGFALSGGTTFSPTTDTEFALGDKPVHADTTIDVDTRQAQSLTASVDNPEARPDPLANIYLVTSTVDGSSGPSTIGLSTNSPDRYLLSPNALPGLTLTYTGAWGRPQDLITLGGKEVDNVVDNSDAGWQGDVTGRLVDIGEQTDPGQIGDVSGAAVLIAPDVTTVPEGSGPTEDQFDTLLTALKAKGAKVILSYDYIQDLNILPVLQLFNPNDIQNLRDQLAQGSNQVHVLGRAYSPYLYALYDSVPAGVPHGKAWHFHVSALAEVDANYRSPNHSPHADDQIFVVTDAKTGLAVEFDKEFMLPQTRTEYYTPGPSWLAFTETGLTTDWADLTPEQTVPVAYSLGRHTTSDWGSGPIGPRLPVVPFTSLDGKLMPWVYRQGDKVFTTIPAFNDADAGHISSPDTDENGDIVDTGSTTLYRDGRKVDSSDVPGVAGFTLPGGSGHYRLVVDGARPAALSSKVHTEWTFTTGHTDPNVRTALDLLDLGFRLPLDQFDAAKAGAPLTGTVTVTHQQGAATPPVTGVTVRVSYDGGKSWRPATTRHTSGGTWSVTVPGGGKAGGSATLSASAVDAAGNTVAETLTGAYGLR
jgi:subtilisin family serine protease